MSLDDIEKQNAIEDGFKRFTLEQLELLFKFWNDRYKPPEMKREMMEGVAANFRIWLEAYCVQRGFMKQPEVAPVCEVEDEMREHNTKTIIVSDRARLDPEWYEEILLTLGRPIWLAYSFEKAEEYSNGAASARHLLFTRVWYSSNPSGDGSLVGTSIVAAINVNRRAGESNHVHGDYAAYIGACDGSSADRFAADAIARKGTKVFAELSELLFRPFLDGLYGKSAIRWRD